MTAENTKSAGECFEVFLTVLRERRLLLEDAIRKSGQEKEPPPYAMTLALLFGERTLAAVQLLVPTPDLMLMTNTLVRPFYELSMRMLWAAREPNGWQRFQAHVAEGDAKWAREAVRMPELRDYAERIRQSREEVLSRCDEDGKPFKPMPNLSQMLSDIETKNLEVGDVSKPGGAEFQYTNVYRVLCRPAHGHLGSFEATPPKVAFIVSAFAAGLATHVLIRALAAIMPGFPEVDADAAGTAVLQVMRAAKDVPIEETESKEGSET